VVDDDADDDDVDNDGRQDETETRREKLYPM
jgi:hypothetical protein